jgi:hypothetical protein
MMTERFVRDPSVNRNSESVGAPLTIVRSVSLNAPISAGMCTYRSLAGADVTGDARDGSGEGVGAGAEPQPTTDAIMTNAGTRFILASL